MLKSLYKKLIGCCVVLVALFATELASTASAQCVEEGLPATPSSPTIRIRTRYITSNVSPDPGAINQPCTERFCEGTPINIPFTLDKYQNGRLLSDNVFRAELSSPTGVFPATPNPNRFLVGFIPGVSQGTIYSDLRLESGEAITYGTRYRIRVVATRPRAGTSMQYVANQTDSTRAQPLTIFQRPCLTITQKQVGCGSNLQVTAGCGSCIPCLCPGFDASLPLCNYQVTIAGLENYPSTFDPATNSFFYQGLAEGWYTFTVRDANFCEAVEVYHYVAGAAAPTLTLSLTNVTHNQALVTWNAISADSRYDLRYRVVEETYPQDPMGGVAANWTEISNITGTTRLLSGLQNNTKYEIQIRVRCTDAFGSTAISEYSLPKYFVTDFIPVPIPASCRTPGGIYVQYINDDPQLGIVNWNSVPTATCYQLRYGPVGGSWTVVNIPLNANNMFNLPYNNPWLQDVTQRVQIRANCTFNNNGNSFCTTTNPTYSQWSPVITFDLPSPRVGAPVKNFSASAISVYPNPTAGIFTVSLGDNGVSNAVISVTDVMGKEVFVKNYETQDGANALSVDLSSQSAGIYMVNVMQGEKLSTTKVIVK